jgi:myo-inositol catabolism protein IolC
MSIGYKRTLYILPFDHRGSFEKEMFGWDGALSAEQTARIAAAKQVIYAGLQPAVAAGLPRDRAGLLVDEQFGAAILADARENGFITAAPAEKSGQAEFDFEYGAEFARHIEAMDPTFCKVLVRYNPEGDARLNARQAARLHQLSEYLQTHNRLFLVEVLVPATYDQLVRAQGDRHAYDLEVRPQLQVRAMHELLDAGVEPDVWKIEGLERKDDYRAVVAAAQRDGRTNVGCVVLGRGENEQKVVEWLSIAAGVPGFIGFAVGRTTWWEPLVGWRDGHLTAEAAAAQIAHRYCRWVGIFEKAATPEGSATR